MGKKKFRLSLLVMSVMTIWGMTSCSNDDQQAIDNGQTAANATEITDDGFVTLTYNVGEAVADSAFTRASAPTASVEKTYFMGMEVTTEITDDAAALQTRGTVYNTVDLNGQRVYAIVYDPETNLAVADMQTLTISDNKLTVKGKRGCKILFYIGGRPSSAKGKDVTTITAQGRYNFDAMQCVSETITERNFDLGMLTFKHVFSKLRVTMKTTNGAIVNAFDLTTKEKIGYINATINVFDRSYVTEGSTMSLNFAVKNNTAATAETAYQNVIIANSGTPIDLSLVFKDSGKGATIDGARNYLTNVNNTLTLKSRVFQPGHRYNINITVRPSNTDQYLNTGFRSNQNFYQWDAYEPFGTGDSLTWSAGNSGMHPTSKSEKDKNIASQSAKNCPSVEDIKMYLGAGVLADDGHTGAYQQSWTYTDPDTGEKTTYHTGVWLKKKQYIDGFAEGTAPKATRSLVEGRPTAETIDQYFFLPLIGLYDMTNYNNPNATGYHRRNSYVNGYTYFQTKTAYTYTSTSSRAYVLKLDSYGASLTSLNWTPRNVCAMPIWSAD